VLFPVLVDDDAEAANAAGVKTIGFLQLLLDPRALRGGRRAHRAGVRTQRSGERITQLGATYVIGLGSTVRYDHIDKHHADHAPLAEVLRAARQPS
jgi:hypothetical protein